MAITRSFNALLELDLDARWSIFSLSLSVTIQLPSIHYCYIINGNMQTQFTERK